MRAIGEELVALPEAARQHGTYSSGQGGSTADVAAKEAQSREVEQIGFWKRVVLAPLANALLDGFMAFCCVIVITRITISTYVNG